MGLHLAGDWLPVLFLRVQFQGYFCSIYLSTMQMQELNAPLVSLLMIPNCEVLLAILRDRKPCRGM